MTEAELQARLLAVVEKVSDASLLLKTGFQIRHPELYEEALKTYGGWERTLAEMILSLRDRDKFEQGEGLLSTTPTTTEEEDPFAQERTPSPEASDPLWGLTTTGELICLEGTDIPLSREPQQLSWPEAYGQLSQLVHAGARSDMIGFSRKGLYFGIMQELMPPTWELETARTLHQWLEIDSDDGLVAVAPRSRLNLHKGRLLHVTAQGKGKATALTEYSSALGRSGREAFLLNEGDVPLAVLFGDTWDGLFCASALGQGIHIKTNDLRSMGRKAVGVNVMRLKNDEDAVVSAFLTANVSSVALITAQGYGKRLSFREFRQQGRGGGGMQVLRLASHDRLVGVVPAQESSDLALLTSTGRCWRMPATALPEMGRAARGKRILEPQSGEEVTHLSALPCAGNLPSQ